jgi:hypothetical protein
MGLLGGLLGRDRKTVEPYPGAGKPYPDAGIALLYRLTTSLNLPGWKDGLPSYTPEEQEAILRKLNWFQEMAKDGLGGEVKFHAEIASDLQRRLAASALVDLADEWKFSDDLPDNWRVYAATYLKAWAATLDPMALRGLGNLLTKAGRCNEARETFQVLLLLPTYADSLYNMPEAEVIVTDIVNSVKEALAGLGQNGGQAQ